MQQKWECNLHFIEKSEFFHVRQAAQRLWNFIIQNLHDFRGNFHPEDERCSWNSESLFWGDQEGNQLVRFDCNWALFGLLRKLKVCGGCQFKSSKSKYLRWNWGVVSCKIPFYLSKFPLKLIHINLSPGFNTKLQIQHQWRAKFITELFLQQNFQNIQLPFETGRSTFFISWRLPESYLGPCH